MFMKVAMSGIRVHKCTAYVVTCRVRNPVLREYILHCRTMIMLAPVRNHVKIVTVKILP